MEAAGYLRPCCKYTIARTPSEDGSSKVDLPTIYEVNSLNDLHNMSVYSSLRTVMQDGGKPTPCNHCWKKESYGLVSRRLDSAEIYSNVNITDGYVHDLEIALDFTCNMMCRICGPHSSSKWGTAKQVVNDLRSVGIDSVDHQSTLSSKYQDTLKRVLENTSLAKSRVIKLQGGETFYAKNFEWFINKLHNEAEDHASLELDIFTNCSIFPDDALLSKLLRFGNLHIVASIDAVGQLADVTRWGVPWETISANLRRWSDLGYMDNLTLRTNTTVSLLNVNKLDDIFDYFDDLRFKVSLSYLNSPSYMSADMVPPDLRQRWVLRDRGTRYRKQIDKHNSYLGSDVQTKFQFDTFLKSMEILDEYQKCSFRIANPEIYALALRMSDRK